MRAISRLVIVAALLVGFAPRAAEAQRWGADLGINGGYSWYSGAFEDAAGVTDGGRFKAGPLLGLQFTLWPTTRMGLRANGTYADRPLTSDEDLNHLLENDEFLPHVNLWSGSLDLLIRLRQPNESWLGRETLPYLALGIGGKWINPAGDQACTDNEGEAFDCRPIHPTPSSTILVDEGMSIMGLVGLGADFRLSPSTALRFEVNDRMYKPKFYPSSSNSLTATSDENVSKLVHEIGAQLGLHLLFGLRTPPPVVVAPPPAPPPPPPPPPAPPAPPREDAITVCVIDPSATGGVRMQAATFRHATRDTIVMVDGQARPLRDAVGNVMVARNAGWYTRGEPLTITVNRETLRYLPYSTGTMIEPNRIVYLGNVNGYPVYADRDEVADVITAINTARAGRTDAELGTILAGNRQARNTVQGAAYLYVPLDPYGCTFQPLARQDDVRKGGK